MGPKPQPTRGKLAREAAAVAAQVARSEIGGEAARPKRKGGGLSNFVFATDHPADGAFILRLGREPEKADDFRKECWAMRRAAKAGVPVADVLAVGEEGGWAWMVQRRVAGEEGTHHPDRRKALQEMGRLTRLIHGVPTRGFGHAFDPKREIFTGAKSWADHCETELRFEERLTILNRNRMLARSQADRLEGVLGEIAGWDEKPVLHHGDMRLKNVMIDGEPGKVSAVIDWDLCASSIGPYWDLSLALHDLSIDAKQAFLDGYGLSEAEIAAMAPALKAFNIINYAPFVAAAADQKDEGLLEQYRTRFSGALDLYSL